MNRKLLGLKPTRYLCPYCGQWHEWNLYELNCYDSLSYSPTLYCKHDDISPCYNGPYRIFFGYNICYVIIISICGRTESSIEQKVSKVSLDSFNYDEKNSRITFSVSFKPNVTIGKQACSSCNFKHGCNFICLADEVGNNDNRPILTIPLGFEFCKADYDRIVIPELLASKRNLAKYLENIESALTAKEQDLANREAELTIQQKLINEKMKKMEETSMEKTTPTTTKEAKQNTTLKTWYLDTTPRQKGQQAMALFNKHKNVLKWTLPIAAIYAAYKILDDPNSGITVENADKIFQETFGEKSEFLSNKAKMNKLVKRGAAIALGYGAVKLSSNFTKPSTVTTVEELESTIDDGVNALSKSKGILSTLAPNASDIVPAAVSVIILFAMVNPMKLTFLDTFKDKLSNLPKFITGSIENAVEWGKDMLVEHFDIDVESPEFKKNSKKILILAVIATVAVFVYGKNIISKKEIAEEEKADSKLKPFMDYLMNLFNKIAPSAFVAVTTVLLTSKIMGNEPTEETEETKIVESEAVVVEDGTPDGPRDDFDPSSTDPNSDDNHVTETPSDDSTGAVE